MYSLAKAGELGRFMRENSDNVYMLNSLKGVRRKQEPDPQQAPEQTDAQQTMGELAQELAGLLHAEPRNELARRIFDLVWDHAEVNSANDEDFVRRAVDVLVENLKLDTSAR